ncbi:MAG: ABC transporter substrate-binding protein [Chloroflexota bacterium]
MAIPADPASLNPLAQTGLIEAGAYLNVYETLLSAVPGGPPAPLLAESVTALDPTTWGVRLRPGVSFQNGEAFDAESVKYSVDTALDPANASPIRAQLQSIQGVEVVGDHAVRITTREPFAPLPAELSTLAMLPPRHATAVGLKGLETAPVGTGPYRLERRVADERLEFRAHAGYWGPAPSAERAELVVLPDGATRVLALLAGEVDVATGLTPEAAATAGASGLRVTSAPGIQSLYLRLHARRPPLDDVRVRRAIGLAIDVQAIIREIYGGHARPLGAPFPEDVMPFEAAEAPPFEPDTARRLIVEAGMDPSVPIVLEAPRGRYPRGEDVAQVVSGYLGAIGLTVETRLLEWGTYLQKVSAGQGEHLFLLAGTNRTYDPHFTLARLYGNGSVFGREYYGSPTIDGPIAEAAATLEPTVRQGRYGAILAQLRADVPAIWLAQLNDLVAYRPPVRGSLASDGLTLLSRIGLE